MLKRKDGVATGYGIVAITVLLLVYLIVREGFAWMFEGGNGIAVVGIVGLIVVFVGVEILGRSENHRALADAHSGHGRSEVDADSH